MQREINLLIIHCSDSSNPKHDDISVITRWHLLRNFKGCGYHYFIKKDGTIQTGRPLEMVGAHCEGFNKNSIGICLSGKTEFTTSQFDSLRDLVDKLRITYNIPLTHIKAHNELDKHGKTCPNFDINFLRRF